MSLATGKSVLESGNVAHGSHGDSSAAHGAIEPTTQTAFDALFPDDTDELEPNRPRSFRKYWVLAIVCSALAALGVLAWKLMAKPVPPSYDVATVHKGNIVKTISATGGVQALTTVDVGTQVSGTVSHLYADFNDRVHAGEIIARLDPSQFEAQYNQATANLQSTQAQVAAVRSSIASADAAVQAAEANVNRLNSVVANAQTTLGRTKALVAEGVLASQQLDTDSAGYAQAVAQQAQGVAELNQAKAQAQNVRSQLGQALAGVKQAQASVDAVKVNLDHTVIRAPIDGVVISRNVDVGQTVAASLQAPTLFVIAKDITKMRVLANIDEADVGQLKTGAPVSFTVDAFPTETFHGTIAEIRLAPQMVQNVVTYTAVINVDNPELKLKPGMTANVTAVAAQRKGVLEIPNTALLFRPASSTASAAHTQEPFAEARRSHASAADAQVWRVEDGTLKPVMVRLGLTDGVSTEVTGGQIKAGDRIATPAGTQTGTAGMAGGMGLGMAFARGGRH